MPERAQLAVGIVLLLMTGSLALWLRMLTGRRSRDPLFEQAPVPHAAPPRWAVAASIAWIGFALFARLQADASGSSPQIHDGLAFSALVDSLARVLIMAILLFGTGDFGPKDVGWPPSDWARSFSLALEGFLLSLLPTAILQALLFPFRDEETQHSLLRLLDTSTSAWTLLALVLAAVLLAPLAEELMFRVTLQGWLRRRVGSMGSIVLGGVIFASVHGWRDGLALLPLACILGTVYDRRPDLIVVFTVHALFNATNLALAMLVR